MPINDPPRASVDDGAEVLHGFYRVESVDAGGETFFPREMPLVHELPKGEALVSVVPWKDADEAPGFVLHVPSLRELLDPYGRVPRWVSLSPVDGKVVFRHPRHWQIVRLDGGFPPLYRFTQLVAGLPPSFKELEDLPIPVMTNLKNSPPLGCYRLDMICLETGDSIEEGGVLGERSEHLRHGESPVDSVLVDADATVMMTGPFNLDGDPLPKIKDKQYRVSINTTDAVDLLEATEDGQYLVPYHVIIESSWNNGRGLLAVRRLCYYEKRRLGIFGHDPHNAGGAE